MERVTLVDPLMEATEGTLEDKNIDEDKSGRYFLKYCLKH